MSLRSRFVVMRDLGEKLEPYGALADVKSAADADVFATLLASKFPQQRFVVLQIVSEYGTQARTEVRRLRLVDGGIG